VEIVRGRLEGLGPVTARSIADSLALPASAINTALAALEAEGFAMRGRFAPSAASTMVGLKPRRTSGVMNRMAPLTCCVHPNRYALASTNWFEE